MSNLVLATDVINADEPCWSLKEFNLQAPDSSGFRRYRIVTVWRAPNMYEWRYDMGPASTHTWEQISIIGGTWPDGSRYPFIPETVGHMMEMAERLHAGYVAPPERPELSDMAGQYHDLLDMRRRERKRCSTYGYGGAIQRYG